MMRTAPPDSLASGAAGDALLAVEQARAGSTPWTAAHQRTAAMTVSPVTAHPDHAGLYRGAPAVAFVLRTASHPAYENALSALDENIAVLTRERLRRAHQRMEEGLRPTPQEYDLINGLTGIGTYLLHHRHNQDLLHEVLAYLVRLTEPLDHGGEELPGWWTDKPYDDRPGHNLTGGYGDLGVAHGIAGPLALLATAMLTGITVPGQTEAISTICRWFDRWRVDTDGPAWWPGRVTRAEFRTEQLAQTGPQRPSWCYGTPGQARALQLAAIALDEPRRQRQAEETLADCVTDPHQLNQIVDSTLCHGWAGLALATWRTAAEAGPDSDLAGLVPDLRALLDEHPSRLPWNAGLLEGQAGLQLVKHTLDYTEPTEISWDRCLLLSG